MKIQNIYISSILIGIALFFGADIAVAQKSENATPSVERPGAKLKRVRRNDLFRELGLSSEQVERIRQIYARNRPVMKEAQEKLREAGRALDRAIYADVLDEGVVRLLLEEQRSAQAEVLRLKYLGEVEVRKVLSPVQLAKFREIRLRFEERRRSRAKQAGERHRERNAKQKP